MGEVPFGIGDYFGVGMGEVFFGRGNYFEVVRCAAEKRIIAKRKSAEMRCTIKRFTEVN